MSLGDTTSPQAPTRIGYLWTTVEEAVLRTHYRQPGGPARCAELLPHRGIHAIYVKALKLGLKTERVSRTAGKRFARTHLPSEQVDTMIREGYAHAKKRGDLKALAARCGRPPWWVSRRATDLGLTIPKLRPRPWERAELALLAEMGHCTLPVIAARLRTMGYERTPTAIKVQLKRSRIDTTDPNVWSARELADLLGVTGKAVTDWIARRGLRARRDGQGPTSSWRITRAALLDWLREHHGYVDLRRVDQPWMWDLLLNRSAAS